MRPLFFCCSYFYKIVWQRKKCFCLWLLSINSCCLFVSQKLQKTSAIHATCCAKRWTRFSSSREARLMTSDKNSGQRKLLLTIFNEASPWIHVRFSFYVWSRNAQTSMKPNAAENSEILSEETSEGVKLMKDEAINGEYGLVINGHSLVRQDAPWWN